MKNERGIKEREGDREGKEEIREAVKVGMERKED